MSTSKNYTKAKLVTGIDPDEYKLIDHRLNKPTYHKKITNGILEGSMLLQDIEEIDSKNLKISYFSPNNIAILLSISEKNIEISRKFFNEKIAVYKSTKPQDNYKINEVSGIVCDYIECIQTSIVFGYTAIETFVNLSIPEDFTHSKKSTNGILEQYDKNAIERWLTLGEKLILLKDIYKANKLENQDWYENFITLEKYRNKIIHQKAIDMTGFYKDYFLKNIFEICSTPRKIISFFYEAHAKDNKTNPIWPWLMDEKNYFPVQNNADESKLEVIGNLYEGIQKKKK
ncbi:MAG: hypothetical protein PHE67_10385 [Campylobacterales bacterium]|nr:hypothetical protein [Campylobacterales bacterium]